ncbi:MAG: phytanoyl-CoA dioxygenase family protein [Myxococcales bacterium]|nr:phytanoyl-CoA dioxygenase family protein [Myxococcales bacterium]
MLDAAQRRRFHDQGFLVLPSQIDPARLAALRAAAVAIVDRFDFATHRAVFSTRDRDAGRDDYFFDSAQQVRCFLEEDALDERGALRKPPRLAINKIGHALHDLEPAFTELCRLPLLGALLRDLGARAPRLVQSMYIFKQPGIGGEVRWHQDAAYLITAPASVTGLWLALEDARRDNGCLWVQPGGHRSPLRERYEVDWSARRGALHQLDDTPWPTPDEALPLEVPAGTLVIFHDHLPHYSARNESTRSRHAFTIHAAEADAAWSPKNWLQRDRLEPFAL